MAKKMQPPRANAPEMAPSQPQRAKAAPAAPKAPPARQQPAAAAPAGLANVPAGKWLMLVLIGIAILANIATLGYGYTLDDPFFTSSNPLVVKGAASIPEFFTHAAYYGVFKHHDASYRPLLLISFALEKQFFGFNPAISHAVNMLLFSGLIAALFIMLRRIFNNYSPFIPFFIVLLFELHPIHTEVVASVKSRDELMAMLFTCLCTIQSFRYIDTDKTKYLVLSGIYFFLALMSKETPVTSVAIVPLTIYFFRDASAKKIITAVAPYLIVAALYMLMRATFIESDGEKVKILVNNNGLMAATNEADKLATALFIQLKYIILLVFPHPLSWDYSYSQIPIISLGNPKALAAIVVLLGLLVFSLANLKRKNIFAYCILYYFALVALTANIIVDIGATMAERFVFSASLGFCIALVVGAARLLKTDLSSFNYANSAKAFYVFGAIALLYSGKTIARNGVWKDNLTLYESGIETAPDSWREHNLLGVEYTKMINTEPNPEIKKELFRKAILHFNRSLEILPDVDVYLLKGYAYEFRGNNESAEARKPYDDSAAQCYRLVLASDSTNQKAGNNLGAVYLREGQFNEAIAMLGKVVRRDTTFIDGLANLAAAYGNSGHLNEALFYYTKVLRLTPDPPDNVLQSMSNIYRILGDANNAQHYQQLLSARKKK